MSAGKQGHVYGYCVTPENEPCVVLQGLGNAGWAHAERTGEQKKELHPNRHISPMIIHHGADCRPKHR